MTESGCSVCAVSFVGAGGWVGVCVGGVSKRDAVGGLVFLYRLYHLHRLHYQLLCK